MALFPMISPSSSKQLMVWSVTITNNVCVTTYQPDPKSNPNPNPTTKLHTIVNIQVNIVTCAKFILDMRRSTICTTLGYTCHTTLMVSWSRSVIYLFIYYKIVLKVQIKNKKA